jgi:predicted phage tail protein
MDRRAFLTGVLSTTAAAAISPVIKPAPLDFRFVDDFRAVDDILAVPITWGQVTMLGMGLMLSGVATLVAPAEMSPNLTNQSAGSPSSSMRQRALA